MVLQALTTWEWIIFTAVLIIGVLGGLITVAILMYRWKWNYKVVVFEKVPPHGYIPTLRCRARLVKFGDGGEEIFYIAKKKLYRTAYGKRIGKNQLMWVIGEDGYWYNSNFEDFDRRLRKLGFNPIHLDMRYANSSLRKGIENRYQDKSFIEKWGVQIAIGMLALVVISIIGGTWFIIEKLNEGAGTYLQIAEVNKDTLEMIKEVLAITDNIKGGSGIIVQDGS